MVWCKRKSVGASSHARQKQMQNIPVTHGRAWKPSPTKCGDMLKTVKKLLPFVCVLVICAVFVFSFIKDMYSEKTQYGFACGSEVKVTVFGTKKGEENAKTAVDEIKRIDEKFLSDTISTSATFKLNEQGKYTDDSGEFVFYVNECLDLVSKCDKMTLLSKPFVDTWDISGDGRVPSDKEIAETVKKADMKNLTVSGNTVTLSNGAKLSFGAFGKGTVCEKGVEILKSEGAKGGIVTVGGTVGVFGKSGKSKEFTVGVRDPFGNAGEYFATVSVSDAYLSTSGDYEKYFEKDGKRYCHIFDATTGLPVESDITSVTVVAKGGTQSDFLSTALFILGEDGIDLAKQENAEFIIVKKDKSVIISSTLEGKFHLVDDSFSVSFVEVS